MRATVKYVMNRQPMQGWAPSKDRSSEDAWFLFLEVVGDDVGSSVAFKPLAMFNSDREAEVFMDHLALGGTVEIDPQRKAMTLEIAKSRAERKR